MTDDAKLIERLKVVARCDTDSTMRHSAYAFMAQDPEGDYVTYEDHAARLTALTEEKERLRSALQDLADASTLEWDSDYPIGQDPLSRARAALSGDDGGV